MPNYFIIYTNGEVTNSCTFNDTENLFSFTKMLRDLEYQYEIYCYSLVDGYIRSTKYPAN